MSPIKVKLSSTAERENISLSFNLNGRGILCHPVKGWFRGPFLPVLNFNLLKAIQDPLYFVPNILIGQNVKKVKEVFPVCSASVGRTPFKGILSRIKAPEIPEVLQLFKFCFLLHLHNFYCQHGDTCCRTDVAPICASWCPRLPHVDLLHPEIGDTSSDAPFCTC